MNRIFSCTLHFAKKLSSFILAMYETAYSNVDGCELPEKVQKEFVVESRSSSAF